MSDLMIVEKIMRSLSPQFNYVVCSIEESKDIEALTLVNYKVRWWFMKRR